MRFFYLTLVLVFITLPSLSCNKQNLPADLPKLYPISVTVVQDGKPLPHAAVALMQLDGVAKWPASGEAGESGVAKKFYTNGMYQGVVAGKFKVCVTKIEREGGVVDLAKIPPEPKDSYEKYQWRQKYIDNQPPSKNFDLVERRYGDAANSPLEIEVTSSGENEFSVDVGKAVRVLYKR